MRVSVWIGFWIRRQQRTIKLSRPVYSRGSDLFMTLLGNCINHVCFRLRTEYVWLFSQQMNCKKEIIKLADPRNSQNHSSCYPNWLFTFNVLFTSSGWITVHPLARALSLSIFLFLKVSSADESIMSLHQLFHYLVILEANKLQVNSRLRFPLNLIFQSLNFVVPLSTILKLFLVPYLQTYFSCPNIHT